MRTQWQRTRSVKTREIERAKKNIAKQNEKVVEAIDSLEDKIKAFELQMDDRETEKEVALGTF